MNNPRRKQLAEISRKLSELRSMLELIKDEEEEYIENLPKNLQTLFVFCLQSSKHYEITKNAVDNLDYALDSLDEAISSIENAAE